MYVCICMYMYVCICKYVYVCMYMYVCICMYDMYVCICMYVYVCMYMYVCICMYDNSLKKCKTGRSTREICDNYNNLSGKELWMKIDWSGKLSSTINYNTPQEESTLEFFKSLYNPANEPSLDNFTVNHRIYIPVTDDPISINEIKEAFNDQRKGIILRRIHSTQ